MENKLEQLINALVDSNTPKAAATATATASPVIASPSATPRTGRRETGGATRRGVASATLNRGGGDPSAETSDGLDTFIDDYHAEVSGR